MPPVASTTIVEKPMTMSMASARETANRLKDDTKPGARLVKTTHSSPTIAASPTRFDCARSRTLKPDLVSLGREKVMDEESAIERASALEMRSWGGRHDLANLRWTARSPAHPPRASGGPHEAAPSEGSAASPSVYLQVRYFCLNEDWISVVIFFKSFLYAPTLSALMSIVPESMKRAVCGVLMKGASAFTVQVPLAKRSST